MTTTISRHPRAVDGYTIQPDHPHDLGQTPQLTEEILQFPAMRNKHSVL